jgi:hypothetical protein
MKIIIDCDINIYSIFIVKLLNFLTKLQNYYVNKKIYKRNKIKDYVRFNKYIIIMLIVIVMKNNRHNND